MSGSVDLSILPELLEDCKLESDQRYFTGRIVWSPNKHYINLRSYIMLDRVRVEYDTLEEAITDNIAEML